jgi:hypothetical protein
MPCRERDVGRERGVLAHDLRLFPGLKVGEEPEPCEAGLKVRHVYP